MILKNRYYYRSPNYSLEGAIKKILKIVICAIVLSAGSAGAQLQVLQEYFTPAKPGAWARYTSSGSNSGGMSEVYLSVAGEETVQGSRHLWYQWISLARGDSTIVKMLLPADSVFKPDVKKMIVKMPGQEAMELPFGNMVLESLLGDRSVTGIDLGSMSGIAEKAVKTGYNIENLGTGKINVGAQKLEAEHLRLTQKDGRVVDIWLSPEVPLFSLVKLVDQGLEVNLAGWGNTGAEDIIGENYRALNLKSLMDSFRKSN